MRNRPHAIDHARRWCSTWVTALALVLSPIAATAAPPGTAPDDVFAPVEIPPPPPAPEPPPEPEPPPDPEPPPAPEPPPQPEPPPPPEPPVEGPTVVDRTQLAKIHAQRNAGLGVMVAGGAVTTVGVGMTLVFTILGDQKQRADDPVLEDIERNDASARVGGLILASGVALVAIGGIVFANANRKAEQRKVDSLARLRVAPAFGGLVVSGRF